jgi:tetratricopeptide (TPR) repeat protein
MSDIEYDEDEQIDYNEDEYVPQDEEDGGLNLEDNFLTAENADDPIQAYKEVIELEISNSNEHKWSFKCYEKLALIYIKQSNISEFENSVKNIAQFYSKIEDRDKQDTIRELCSDIRMLTDTKLKIEFYQVLIKHLKENGITREYFYVGVELCKLFSLNKKYDDLKNIVPSLYEDVDNYEEKEMVKNIKLELIIMKMQIFKHEGNTIDIKSLYLDAQKLMVDQVFEDKFLTGIINEEGGKILMRQKDFDKALEKFKFAFHSYKDTGSEEEAVTTLKYAFIVSLLVLDSSIIVTKEEANLYKKHESLMKLVSLFDAYNALDIKKTMDIWKKEILTKEKDKFILENKEDILYNMRINYVVRKLKAYKNCKFDVIESEIGVNNDELLGMVMNIAKNQLANIKINFVKKQLEIKDDNSDNTIKLLSNYKGWLNKLI